MAAYDPMALLSKPLDDFHAPTKPVLGSYVAISPGYEFDKTKPADKSKEPTNIVRVKVALVEALPDVDQDLLKQFLEEQAAKGKEGLLAVEMRPIDFFLTPDAMFRFTDFTRDHAKITPEEAPTGQEALEVLKTEARQFGVFIEAVPNKREPENPYHQITRTFALS